MARVRFTADFDYRPSGAPGVIVAHKAGRRYTVKRECADEAVAAGKAELLEAEPETPPPPPPPAPAEPGSPRRRAARIRNADRG